MTTCDTHIQKIQTNQTHIHWHTQQSKQACKRMPSAGNHQLVGKQFAVYCWDHIKKSISVNTMFDSTVDSSKLNELRAMSSDSVARAIGWGIQNRSGNCMHSLTHLLTIHKVHTYTQTLIRWEAATKRKTAKQNKNMNRTILPRNLTYESEI